MNDNYIIVLDFETGSTNKYDPIVLEAAAVVLDPRTLKRVEGGTFESFVKPYGGWGNVQAKALDVNKLDKDEVDEKGVSEEVFFERFAQFFKGFTRGNKWKAPIVAGYNSDGFDRIILESLCHRYGYVDKDGEQKMFHPRDSFDVMKMCLMWFENESEPARYRLEDFCEYFGIERAISHRAMADVEPTADILCRFLQFHRKIQKKNKPQFRGAFGKPQEV